MAMCQVCRRTMLVGERHRTWRWARREHAVCVPCEPKARRAGWLRAVDTFEHVHATGLIPNARRVA